MALARRRPGASAGAAWLLLLMLLRHAAHALRHSAALRAAAVSQPELPPVLARIVTEVQTVSGGHPSRHAVGADIAAWAGDRCGGLLGSGGNATAALRPATPFDAAMAEYFVKQVLNPADAFLAAVAKVCEFRATDRPTELQVGDRCRTPGAVEAVKKTVLSARLFDKVWREWVAVAKAKAAASQGAGAGPPTGRGESSTEDSGTALVQTAATWLPPTGASAAAAKRAFVGLLLANPEAREHREMTQHGEAARAKDAVRSLEQQPLPLVPEVAADDLPGGGALGEPGLRSSAAGDAAEGPGPDEKPRTPRKIKEAKRRLEVAEETFDVGYATTHLADVVGDLGVIHTVLQDEDVAYEVRALTKVAQTIVSKEPKILDMIPGTYVATDTLVKAGADTSLGVVEDVLIISMNAPSLVKASRLMVDYAVARVGQLVDDLPKLPHSAAARHGVHQHQHVVPSVSDTAPDMNEAQLTLELIKGSDAMVRLAMVWARFPADLCHALPAVLGSVGVQAANTISSVGSATFGSILPP